MDIDRRRFVASALAPSAAWLAGARAGGAPAPGAPSTLPPPDHSGIEHIVVVMLENRSFDHMLGWLWTANGRQAGLSYLDKDGRPHVTHRLLFDYKGCAFSGPDHSYLGGRTQYHEGRMDGFLRSGSNDEFSIGYYRPLDIPFFSALATHYTTLDACFCSILGPTFPNRFFLHAAQTDRIDNDLVVSTLPTIWDRLQDAGVSGRYYFANLPFLALWGPRHLGIARPFEQFLSDAAHGTLPAVSFVDPRFTVLDGVFANDDHPHADIRAGDAFLSSVFHALSRGPSWSSTVLVITFDEWGGFFDHVPPPRAAAPNGVDPDVVDGRALLGFRVPVVVASPFTRGFPLFPRVSSMTFDHTSILKLIEWRWNLSPLTARDGSDDVGNLTSVLRFDAPDPGVPFLPEPSPPWPRACVAGVSNQTAKPGEWDRLAGSRLLDGWAGSYP
jgi:phospholipase C